MLMSEREEKMSEKDQSSAMRDKSLFRYRLIAPLLDPDLKRGDVRKLLSAAAERTHILPDGREVRFSYETIKSWYMRYKKLGFEALKNKSRADCGVSRAIPEDVIQKAVDLKLEVPQRSLLRIISILEQGKVVLVNTLKKSTLRGRQGQSRFVCYYLS